MQQRNAMNNIPPERQEEIKRRAKQDYVAMKAGWPVKPIYTKDEEYLCWFNELQLLKKGAK
jgi:hypothetical protein